MRVIVLKDFVSKTGSLCKAGSVLDWAAVGAYGKGLLQNEFVKEIEEPHIPGQAVECARYCPEFSDLDGVYAGWGLRFHPIEVREAVASVGLSFETEEQCEAWIKRAQAEQILRRDAKGFKPDWDDATQCKYYVTYDTADNKLLCCWGYVVIYNAIYFATLEDAQSSIKTHAREWKTYLGVKDGGQ